MEVQHHKRTAWLTRKHYNIFNAQQFQKKDLSKIQKRESWINAAMIQWQKNRVNKALLVIPIKILIALFNLSAH